MAERAPAPNRQRAAKPDTTAPNATRPRDARPTRVAVQVGGPRGPSPVVPALIASSLTLPRALLWLGWAWLGRGGARFADAGPGSGLQLPCLPA